MITCFVETEQRQRAEAMHAVEQDRLVTLLRRPCDYRHAQAVDANVLGQFTKLSFGQRRKKLGSRVNRQQRAPIEGQLVVDDGSFT